MKTVCVFKAEITIAVSENWQVKAPIQQITDDAKRFAEGRVDAARAAMRENGIGVANLKFVRAELHADDKS